jgi:hypothetical protein
MVHRAADQFAEAHFRMYLADDVTQFGAHSQKNVDLPDLFQNGEGLFADRLTFRTASA